jgi:hypothetical protein
LRAVSSNVWWAAVCQLCVACFCSSFCCSWTHPHLAVQPL